MKNNGGNHKSLLCVCAYCRIRENVGCKELVAVRARAGEKKTISGLGWAL